MAHDFVKFPELTNSQMEFYYHHSPHKQILESFEARVTKVIDGDTILLEWEERDFEFPLRFLGTNAPEMNEEGGADVKEWLEDQILDEEVYIRIDPNERVGKWGRILGHVIERGIDVGNQMLRFGLVTTFDARREGEVPDLNKTLNMNQWL